MSGETSDVVVVGSGAAGMMAALRSVVAGARVTVLEVSDLFGGTSAISGGGMWLPRTRLAREAGIEDSRDDVKRYLTYLTKDTIDETVVDRFIDTAPLVIDFLEEHTALRFYVDRERPDYKTTFPGAANCGDSWPRCCTSWRGSASCGPGYGSPTGRHVPERSRPT